MTLFRSISCILVLFVAEPAFGAGFTYEAPEQWNALYPTCNGSRQSPVNILTDRVTDKVFPPLRFVNYDRTPLNSSILNNGFTAKVTVDVGGAAPHIFGGPLRHIYRLAEYHFHWGVNDTVGSEHLVNGHGYPLETHFVHWNTKYGNLSNALQFPDGLAVLGILSDISPNDVEAFKFLINLPRVRKVDTGAVVKSLPKLVELLPARVQEYWSLPGSLTTPLCDEVVTWIVFRNRNKISSKQLQGFRYLRNKQNKRISLNNRPPQPLNGRTVFRSVSFG